MDNYKINIKKSYEMYNNAKEYVEDGFCYNNCINVLGYKYLHEFKSGTYNIGYCYITGKNYCIQRHCVILTKDKEIIDLSLPLLHNNKEDRIKDINEMTYYVFKQLNFNEYVNLLRITKSPAFEGFFIKEELKSCDYLLEKGYVFNDVEYEIFIKPFINEKDIVHIK